jgi:hypothetical protein
MPGERSVETDDSGTAFDHVGDGSIAEASWPFDCSLRTRASRVEFAQMVRQTITSFSATATRQSMITLSRPTT